MPTVKESTLHSGKGLKLNDSTLTPENKPLPNSEKQPTSDLENPHGNKDIADSVNSSNQSSQNQINSSAGNHVLARLVYAYLAAHPEDTWLTPSRLDRARQFWERERKKQGQAGREARHFWERKKQGQAGIKVSVEVGNRFKTTEADNEEKQPKQLPSKKDGGKENRGRAGAQRKLRKERAQKKKVELGIKPDENKTDENTKRQLKRQNESNSGDGDKNGDYDNNRNNSGDNSGNESDSHDFNGDLNDDPNDDLNDDLNNAYEVGPGLDLDFQFPRMTVFPNARGDDFDIPSLPSTPRVREQ
jgi:hypothetical protein